MQNRLPHNRSRLEYRSRAPRPRGSGCFPPGGKEGIRRAPPCSFAILPLTLRVDILPKAFHTWVTRRPKARRNHMIFRRKRKQSDLTAEIEAHLKLETD